MVDGIEFIAERPGEVAVPDAEGGEDSPGLLPITTMVRLRVACHIVLSFAQLKCYFHTFVELDETGKSKYG